MLGNIMAQMTSWAEVRQILLAHVMLIVRVPWPPIGMWHTQMGGGQNDRVCLAGCAEPLGTVEDATPFAAIVGASTDSCDDLVPVLRIVFAIPGHSFSRLSSHQHVMATGTLQKEIGQPVTVCNGLSESVPTANT